MAEASVTLVSRAVTVPVAYWWRDGYPVAVPQLIYQSPMNEKWLVSPELSDDRNTLLISIGDSCDPVNRQAIGWASRSCSNDWPGE